MIVRCFSEVADTQIAQVCSQQNGDASVSFSRDVEARVHRWVLGAYEIFAM